MFPTFLYHREKGAKLVKDEAEAKALGKGWEDSPAKVGLVPVEKLGHMVYEKDPDFEEKAAKVSKPAKDA